MLGQAGLKLLASSDPPALASQSARNSGVSHRAQPRCIFETSNHLQSPTSVFWLQARGQPLSTHWPRAPQGLLLCVPEPSRFPEVSRQLAGSPGPMSALR